MTRALVAAFALAALLPLSGCFGSDSSGFDFVPGTKFKETGRTVHLKATVVDYDSEIFPGLTTWLWAFCFEPVDPTDTYSADAIEGWTHLAGDKVAGTVSEHAKCSVPGPTLRVKQGDTVKVEFSHSHFHAHTIHWHGQFVPWDHDGAPGVAQDSIASGNAFTYEFVAKRAGTLWYHCHVDTQLHIMQGLYGVIIVEPQDDKYEPKDIDEEYVIVLSTMNRNAVEAVGTSRHNHAAGCVSGSPAPCENPSSTAGRPDVFLLNGHSYPYTMDQAESLITMKEGDRIRLRILNAGETVETLHPHGHDMQVVAKDGNPLSKSSRYWADTLTIAPAERYDVVIEANNPGPWMIHTHTASHETNCAKSPGGMHTMIVYEGFEDKMHQFQAEAPVDCPPGESLELPGDFHNSTSYAAHAPQVPLSQFPPGQQPPPHEFAWSFPVELPCAVRSLEFYATTWQSAANAQANPANLAITLTPPKGETERAARAAGTNRWEFVAKEHSLNNNVTIEPGLYRVDVTTTGADVKVDLDVHVDYYETFEQTKIGHLTYSVGGCSGYT